MPNKDGLHFERNTSMNEEKSAQSREMETNEVDNSALENS